jgi:molecular chaperone GrpE
LCRFKYLQADFENYRKRVDKAVQESIQRSNEKLILNIIEVVDDLENAISAGKNTENKKALLEGVQMVHKKLDKILEKEGLVRLESVGKPFDPKIHDVLAEVPTKGQQRGTVVEETRKGFMFKGKVLRPCVVKVACEESGSEKNE